MRDVYGSSPRERGTLRGSKALPAVPRIIPARAGNTADKFGAPTVVADHPRASGEHFGGDAEPCTALYGSSPRERGTRLPSSLTKSRSALSDHPRASGEHIVLDRSRVKHRSTDHPRASGEHELTRRPTADESQRIIPARAGNTSPAPTARI